MIKVVVINPEALPAASEKFTKALCELYLQKKREEALKQIRESKDKKA